MDDADEARELDVDQKAEVYAQRAAEDENTIDDADETRELDIDPKAGDDIRRAARG